MHKMTGALLLLVTALAACAGESNQSNDAGDGLPRLHAQPLFTVSGISAGAYLAGQLHVAYSADINGAGLIAGGPWGCADGSIQKALSVCITGDGVDPAALAATATTFADKNAIDDLENLQDDAVYIFHGTQDVVVAEAVSDAAADWYRQVAPQATLAIEKDVPATHGWPTLDSGAACGEFREPWINACEYDLAGVMLTHLLGPMKAPGTATAATAKLRRFSQEPFAASSMADEGLLYVPAHCASGERCRVHVFLHGCKQAASQIGDVLAEQSGLLRWAESNDLIVLFPQAAASSIAPMNPLACWDWWGYSGANYLKKEGPQLAAIRAMVARLQAPAVP